VHCIRWPGSWHRKGEPRLCTIESCNPDVEIDLGNALVRLLAVSPSAHPEDKGSSTDDDGDNRANGEDDWRELIGNIIAGNDLHDSIARLAAKYIRSGVSAGTAVNHLRGLMDLSAAKKDRPQDWQSRYDDIPRAVESAHKKFSEDQRTDKPATPLVIKTSAQFIAGFVPPDYILDGILQQGFLYSLTGATGAGKTSIALRLAASTALGILFAGRETKQCRVLYLAAENPDDTRMRWIALAQAHGIRPGHDRGLLQRQEVHDLEVDADAAQRSWKNKAANSASSSSTPDPPSSRATTKIPALRWGRTRRCFAIS
jgi:hypothetical protein